MWQFCIGAAIKTESDYYLFLFQFKRKLSLILAYIPIFSAVIKYENCRETKSKLRTSEAMQRIKKQKCVGSYKNVVQKRFKKSIHIGRTQTMKYHIYKKI